MRWMRRDTLLDFFASFDENSGRFLIYDDGFRSEAFPYGEVVRRAREFAVWLRSEAFQAGDKVVLYGENRPEWVIAFWGCLLEGVIVVPVDFRSPLDFVRRVCQITAARLVLTGTEAPPLEPTAGVRALPLGSLVSNIGMSANIPATVTAENTAEIIFTSGATSDPKGVVITHSNVLANVVPVEREVLKYREWARPFFPVRFLNLLPLSHMFGQAMATFIPPMLGGEVVFMRGYNPAEILRQVRTRRISVLVSVPMILEMLREHVLQRFPDLRANPPTGEGRWYRRWWKHRRVHNAFGWKFWAFIVGAAPLPADVETFWSNLGFLVIQGYGLTETAPIVTLNHPFHASKGTVGKPIGGVEVKIAEDGEILVRGPNVTRGYYNAEAETARAFDAEGWFHTGDIGKMDELGRLAIVGRKKEMIVTPEGLNVFPEDVERVLHSIPGVRDAAVIGTDRVHAVLLLEPGAGVDDIVRQANARLADHQKIRAASLWPWPDFPRTEGTRKLKRHEIARGAPPPPSTGQQRFAPETPLDALSSLERVELMVNLDVDEATLAEASTVDDFRRRAERQATVPAPVTFPSLESLMVGAGDPANRSSVHTAAAHAAVRLDSSERPREPSRRAWAGNIRAKPPVPYGRAGADGLRGRTLALSYGSGHGARFLPRPLSSARAFLARVVHQQPELLSGSAVLQRVPHSKARVWNAGNDALHRRAQRSGRVPGDLSGGQAHRSRRDCTLPARSGHAGFATRCAGGAGSRGRAGKGSAQELAHGAARPGARFDRQTPPSGRGRLRGSGTPGGGGAAVPTIGECRSTQNFARNWKSTNSPWAWSAGAWPWRSTY